MDKKDLRGYLLALAHGILWIAVPLVLMALAQRH